MPVFAHGRTRCAAVASAGAAIASAAPDAMLSVATSQAKPFQPQHIETATRPWPRAVLPQYSGGSALTASFGNSTAESPSFYPFEPLPAESEATGDPSPRR